MKSVRNIVSVAKKNNDQSELFTEMLRTAWCFSITVSLCSLFKTSLMLTFCIQFFFSFFSFFYFFFFFFFFLIKKCSLSQKSILFQQNKLFHEGNRTIATRIIATWTIAPQTLTPPGNYPLG